MTKAEAKEILTTLLIKVMDDGSATIELGTPESKALITILKS
jgi:hypothetical protein